MAHVLLLLFGLTLALTSVESQMVDKADKALIEKCEKEILQKADKKRLETAEGKKQCMEDCVCENLGVLTSTGEIALTVPAVLVFIDPETYEVNRLKCNKAVHNAPYCEKWNDMKDCMELQDQLAKT